MGSRAFISFVITILSVLPTSVTGRTWTWVSGDTTVDQYGYYGTQGVPDHGNMPGSRGYGVSWTDSSGNLWLFGGGGYAASGNYGNLNDLWRFDGANWAWISGSDAVNQSGVYGSQGVPAPGNVPGAREECASSIDSDNNLWLFGGYGDGRRNDLWRFDGTYWTWVKGSSLTNQAGVYGTLGVPAPGNTPGARSGSVSWTDNKGKFWLFGGYGHDASGSVGSLNDLWRFNGTNWGWFSGSSAGNQVAVYGTQGVPASGNRPGARQNGATWIDESGNLWLFGGYGLAASGSDGYLNDLWKWDGTYWTWVSGSNTIDQYGVYGMKGVANVNNVPGARYDSVSWIDTGGNLWLFGGVGFAASGSDGYLNDLWKWDGTYWTWISGSNTVDQYGVYATGGVPGARQAYASWKDGSGRLLLFGGDGYAASGSDGFLNDFWMFGIPDEAADVTADGIVNYLDLLVLADEWLNDRHPSADFAPQPMGDNRVTFLDFAFFANQWMKSM